jgi:hypothetical protein
MVAHLISQFRLDEFTIAIYHELFQTLQSFTCEQLQQNLLSEILASFPFVMQLPEQTQVRIFKHWKQTLFALFPHACPPEELFGAIASHYGAPDFAAHCTLLTDIFLNSVSHSGLTEPQFHQIVCDVINSNGPDVLSTLARILIRIVLQYPDAIRFPFHGPDFLSLMDFLVRHPTESGPLFAVELLARAFRSNLLDSEFSISTIYFLFGRLSPDPIPDAFFAMVLGLLASDPILLPLAAWLAYHKKGSSGQQFCAALIPSLDFITSPCWAVWPLILCSTCQPQQRDGIVHFLINCDRVNVDQLFVQLLFVYRRSSILLEEMTALFVSIVQFLSEQSPQLFDVFQYVIFFANPTISDARDVDIAKGILDDLPPEFDVEFRLRFDDQNNWKHIPLAIQCLEMFARSPAPNALFFVLVLCGFLEATDFDGVPTYLESLRLTEDILATCRTAVELIQYHALRSGHHQFFLLDLRTLVSPLTSEAKYLELLERVRPTDFLSLYPTLVASLQQLRESIQIRAHEIEQFNVSNCGFETIIQDRRHAGENQWNSLWDVVTFESAPWNSPALSKSHEKEVGNSFLSSGIVPLRMSRIACADEVAPVPPGPPLCVQTGAWARSDDTQTVQFAVSQTCLSFANVAIPLDTLKWVLTRPFGLEFYTTRGRSYLIHLTAADARSILDAIEPLAPPSLELFQTVDNVSFWETLPYSTLWVTGQMSSFEYIMRLNIVSGLSLTNHTFPRLHTDYDLPSLQECPRRDLSARNNLAHLSRSDLLSEGRSTSMNALLGQSQRELNFEFFCLPEFFPPDFQFPPWADGALDFVYQHRKLLEGDEVSAQLHEWINTVWNSAGPFRLFRESHPARNCGQKSSALVVPCQGQMALGSIDACHVFHSTSLLFTISCLALSGTYFETTFDLRISPIVNSDRATRSEPDMRKRFLTRAGADLIPASSQTKRKLPVFDGSSTVVGFGKRKFLVLQYGRVHLVTGSTSVILLETRIANATAICCDDHYLAIGDASCGISVFRGREFVHSFKLYLPPIETIKMNVRHGLVVAGTAGSLAVCDLFTGSVVDIIKMEYPPRKILVSPSWGFIVVYCTFGSKRFLELYTINAVFVKRTPITVPIDVWYCWTSPSGFDYLIYGDGKGDLYGMELYDLKPGKRFYECKTPLIRVAYARATSTAIAVSRQGLVHFIPITPLDFE